MATAAAAAAAAAMSSAASERCYREAAAFGRGREATAGPEILVELGLPPLPGGAGYQDWAGGFCYEESAKLQSSTRNRFIHWWVSKDVLHLQEHWLDGRLSGSFLRIRFGGGPGSGPVPGGVHVHENPQGHLTLLLLTSISAHRLLLAHPDAALTPEFSSQEFSSDRHARSVLSDVGRFSLTTPDSCFVFGGPTGVAPRGAGAGSCAWVNWRDEAQFAFASPSGGIVVVTLPPPNAPGVGTSIELKQSSMVQRLTGWVPSVIRGDQTPAHMPVSMAAHVWNEDVSLFALCQDNKLRVWSIKDQVCHLECNLSELVPRVPDVRNSPGPRHLLRLCHSSTAGLQLAAHLCWDSHSQFCVLRMTEDRAHLKCLATLLGNQESLRDFAITPTELWALWISEEGDAHASCTGFLPGDNHTCAWSPVLMQPLPSADLQVPAHLDPKEVFLRYIFHPGRFSLEAIVKALHVYRRGADHFTGSAGLQHQVVLAVEREVSGLVAVGGGIGADAEGVAESCWRRLLACVCQYQDVLARPLGILANAPTSLVCLLKPGSLSLLVPCAPIEQLFLSSPTRASAYHLGDIVDDPDTLGDMCVLLECVRCVCECLGPELTWVTDMEPGPPCDAEILAQEFAHGLVQQTDDDVDLPSRLLALGDLIGALRLVLAQLDLGGRDLPTSDHSSEAAMMLGVYAGDLGVMALAQAAHQSALTRLEMCWGLLVLQAMLHEHSSGIGRDTGELFESWNELRPHTVTLLRCYSVLVWAGQCLSTVVPANALECDLRSLSVLDISGLPTVSMDTSSGPCAVVLTELLLGSSSRARALSARAPRSCCLTWPQLSAAVVADLLHDLWPLGGEFIFGEFLSLHCQNTQLQRYCNLLEAWCRAHEGSRSFLLGQSYLVCGEPHKAVDCFGKAAGEVEKEPFLRKFLSLDTQPSACSPRMEYFSKVVRLLENLQLAEQVIDVAGLAVATATEGDGAYIASLQTRIFRQHLELGHYAEAFQCMMGNVDTADRKNCLRALIVRLMERSQLYEIVSLPFEDLEGEVVGILEERARSVDLLSHNTYELLYAFHVRRKNLRKASSVMLEYARRLGRELPTLAGLRKQVPALLLTLTCLRLTPAKYAWIAFPCASHTPSERPGASPKRDHDGETVQPPPRHRVEVVEVEDVQRELSLARARLRLAELHPDVTHLSASGSSAEELVPLLVQAGLMDVALSLSRSHGLSLEAVFTGLAFKCVMLQNDVDDEQEEAWNWLSLNELPTSSNSKETTSPADEAWRLLACYLEKHGDPTRRAHHAVIGKLLSLGAALPTWLVNVYKAYDTPALLRLYLRYDLLEEAAELSLELLDAVQGSGHTYFGIQDPLSATAPPVWVPYSTIDQLLFALQEGSSPTDMELRERLLGKIHAYHERVEGVSRDMLHLANQRACLQHQQQQ
ncbi:nuclear pore complex protein Nup160 isoform X3 [Lampetra planeri]